VFSTGSSRKQKLIKAAILKGFKFFEECPKPALLMSGSVIDGGLLTISRYPIVASQFHSYKTPAVQSDVLCNKGCLYTKIDIS
jgi:hypothetical protein